MEKNNIFRNENYKSNNTTTTQRKHLKYDLNYFFYLE